MILQVIVFLFIGFFVGFLAHFNLSQQAKIFDPWGSIIIGIIGSLVGGFLAPAFNIFVLNYVLLGSFLMAILGAMSFIWLASFIKMIIFARPNSE